MKSLLADVTIHSAVGNECDATYRLQREHEGCTLSHFRLWSLQRVQDFLVGPKGGGRLGISREE